MNPAILARLFQAHADALNDGNWPLAQPQNPDDVPQEFSDMNTEEQLPDYYEKQPGFGQGPLPLQQEPGDLWAQGGSQSGNNANIDLSQPQQSDPGAMPARSSGDMALPPSDYKYLDRVEGDDNPLGVMFGQSAGQPEGAPSNVPMGQLPPGAQEGQYISPLDMKPPSGRMSLRRP